MRRDQLIVDLIRTGRLQVDSDTGLVVAPKSNTPERPVGAHTPKGYLRVCMSVDGRQRHFMVHRIVWVSIHGALPEGWQVNHRNGVKDDNRLSNLEAVTCAVNMAHAADNQLTRPVTGSLHHAARLTIDEVRDIRSRARHESTVSLAGEYGVTASHVRRIIRGTRWSRELDGESWDQFPGQQGALL